VTISLTSLLEKAEIRVAGMAGVEVKSLSDMTGIHGHSNNMEAIVTLRDCWASRYPEAGSHYLALRCWGLLIWQPIYLSVISVECSSAAPDITQMCQSVPADGFICGYAIARHVPYRGYISDCMEYATQKIKAMCDGFRYELSQTVRLNPRAAACMQADCVLGAILATRECDNDACNADAIKRGERWLTLLGLGERSRFFSFRLAGSRSLQSIAIDRQVCCHYFRRKDGEQKRLGRHIKKIAIDVK